MKIVERKASSLTPAEWNVRVDHDLDGIAESIERNGFRDPVEAWVFREGERLPEPHEIVVGEGRYRAAVEIVGLTELPVVEHDFADELAAKRYSIVNNRLTDKSRFDLAALQTQLEALPELDGTGFTPSDLEELRGASDHDVSAILVAQARTTLAERFIVPPFSVLDARQGYWQDRKRAWIALGIKSELGRGNTAPGKSMGDGGSGAWLQRTGNSRVSPGGSPRPASQLGADGYTVRGDGRGVVFGIEGNIAGEQTGTSIFDPVLCELAYRWFCPMGGSVLDPFAGGSVRGVVAAKLGHPYIGVDLRSEQVAANEEQATNILVASEEPIGVTIVADPNELTPVERRGDFWIKRDDLFEVAGVRGGKARTCWALAQGAGGLTTAGSRQSPQVNLVAHIAAYLNVPCRVHTPQGELSPEVKDAAVHGAEVVQHKAGYNNVIIARAREDAKARGWVEIPFGMECREAVEQTRRQVQNIPHDAARLIVPVGSGMSLAGVLWGLRDAGNDVPVLGVCVGADPSKRLDMYAPPDWRSQTTLVESSLDYHVEAPETDLNGLALDPIYEAKCLSFLAPGDCLWVVGVRRTALVTPPSAPCPMPHWIVGDSRDLEALVEGEFDLIFTCPPYFDLEQYSNDPADLSNAADYPTFREAFAQIVKQAAARLRVNRFACIVVGEVRRDDGPYHGLVPDTIRLCEDAGLSFYNDTVLVTACGSLPLRAGRIFQSARKLGKTHQNVLVFYKGDSTTIRREFGDVECGGMSDFEFSKEAAP